jgi:hypothetical protein
LVVRDGAGEARRLDGAVREQIYRSDLAVCVGAADRRRAQPRTPDRAAALRVIGLDQDPHFTNYHRVLNRSRWSSRQAARCLFRLLVSTFVPSGPVIIGLDDTPERRCGVKIAARGIYRDPTRSSHGHFVKASGLRWLSIMILPKIAWAGRVWELRFLAALALSER